MARPTENREGERFKNKEGCWFIIKIYNRSDDLWVQFEDEKQAMVHTQYHHCVKGKVKNPYFPIIQNVGFLGVGTHNPKDNKKCYDAWKDMLRRCYDEKRHKLYPTYVDCTVCEEWHNYQNFANWYEKNYYEVENESMEIDKDILKPGNRTYSPENCLIVPHRINSLFLKAKTNSSGCIVKNYNQYEARCMITTNNGRELKYLGLFKTKEEAIKTYINFKTAYVKQVAEEYKDKIPKKVYEAMILHEFYIEWG